MSPNSGQPLSDRTNVLAHGTTDQSAPGQPLTEQPVTPSRDSHQRRFSLAQQTVKRRTGKVLWLWAALVVATTIVPLFVLIDRSANAGVRQGKHEVTWGRKGLAEGRLMKPRAVTIHNDEIYLVDKLARIHVYDRDGNFLRGWRTPKYDEGKPTGLSFNRAGQLMVADTHCYRILFYTPQGELLENETLGTGVGGTGEGEFGWVTDVVEDSKGCLYVSEYGDYDRIQKFSPDREFLFQWGGHGSEEGQFMRPQGMKLDENDHLWVADSCNHRIQIFDATGDRPELIRTWGEMGSEPGQFKYPYDLLLDNNGYVYVCEFGNHRVQKFDRDGQLVGTWGQQGREEAQLHNPWALTQDSRGRIYVVDTYNHRVHRIRL